MTAQSLGELLAGPGSAELIVAFDRNGASIDLGQFRRDVAGNVARLKAISCEAGLLACADTYWAAVGLSALFVLGAKAALAPTLSPESWGGYRAADEVLVTDQRQAVDPRSVLLGDHHHGDQ